MVKLSLRTRRNILLILKLTLVLAGLGVVVHAFQIMDHQNIRVEYRNAYLYRFGPSGVCHGNLCAPEPSDVVSQTVDNTYMWLQWCLIMFFPAVIAAVYAFGAWARKSALAAGLR